jgi:hypothetical protein
MSSATNVSTLICAALTRIALPACTAQHFSVYRAEISANQQALSKLELGRSSEKVRSTLGEGELVNYKKLYLVDPWRTEAFALADGTGVQILFYVTQPPRKYYRPEDHELTPIVLENDRVVGWGWSYLSQKSDRYRYSVPREQR